VRHQQLRRSGRLYDTFEDRWIITDFAFRSTAAATSVNPPGALPVLRRSKTGDPGRRRVELLFDRATDGLNDYPKLGIWPDGLYMSANMFGFAAGSDFQGVRVWAFNKAQMYAGSPTVQVVSFDVGGGDFTVLPSNARLQTGTPPPGRPNYFISTWNFLNALTVYKFHVDWNSISLSTFTGPDIPDRRHELAERGRANAPQPGTQRSCWTCSQIRAMVQNQYTNSAASSRCGCPTPCAGPTRPDSPRRAGIR
jgi:hypothetical protein